MIQQYHPIVWGYGLVSLMTFIMAVWAWSLRPARGALLVAVAMSSTALWSLTEAGIILTNRLSWIMAYTRVQYIGIIGTPIAWLLFAITYSQFQSWLTPRRTVGILAFPAFYWLVVLTLHWHPLQYTYIGTQLVNGLTVFDREYGVVFWLWVAYAYTSVFLGGGLLLYSVLRYPTLYRGQVVALVGAAVIPLLSSVLFLSGNNIINPFDPSPMAYGFSGVLLMVALSRYRLLEVMPVAYDAVFRHVQSGVLVVDRRGVVRDMNPYAEGILGKSRDEAVGTSMFAVLPPMPKLNNRDASRSKREVVVGERVFEYQANPIPDADGKINGQVIMLYDLTEQKRLLRERDEMIHELNAYNRTVAHDLKNPLAGIIGYGEILEETISAELDPINQEMLTNITQSATRMNSIIQNLLTLARIRSLREVDVEVVDMAEVLDNTLYRFKFQLQIHDVIVEQPPYWLPALGYTPWIEEIWSNYISNAIKYGGTPPRLVFGCDRHENHIRYWVQDNGAGIPEEVIPMLFLEFSRLDHHKRHEGHGLGLSIVARITEKLEGSCGVESRVGHGSKFYFSLPAIDTRELAATI
jgi:PAS domain S-box-containing protein